MANEDLADVRARRPLYKKLEVVERRQESTALEERKKKLSEIRNFYKPIDPQEMKSHLRAYSSTKK